MVKKLIGRGGCHTKGIYDLTGAKLRVRGQGSGHKEWDGEEASVPLMLAVSLDNDQEDKFVKAMKLCLWKLIAIEKEFKKHCVVKFLDPALADERLWNYGEMSDESEELLTKAKLLERSPINKRLNKRYPETRLQPDRPSCPGLVKPEHKPFLKVQQSPMMPTYLAGPACYGDHSMAQQNAEFYYEQASSSGQSASWVCDSTWWQRSEPNDWLQWSSDTGFLTNWQSDEAIDVSCTSNRQTADADVNTIVDTELEEDITFLSDDKVRDHMLTDVYNWLNNTSFPSSSPVL